MSWLSHFTYESRAVSLMFRLPYSCLCKIINVNREIKYHWPQHLSTFHAELYLTLGCKLILHALQHILYHWIVLLYCIVLCCVVLYCVALYCVVLCRCIVLYCIVLCCIALCCVVLRCVALYCVGLYCIVLCCVMLCCTKVAGHIVLIAKCRAFQSQRNLYPFFSVTVVLGRNGCWF